MLDNSFLNTTLAQGIINCNTVGLYRSAVYNSLITYIIYK